jgi:ketol-acid reductoisomerase
MFHSQGAITVADVVYDQDADLPIIQTRKVAIVGFGGLARAHAENLRDTGVEVMVASDNVAEGSIARAVELGFPVKPVAAAAAWANVVMLLTDEATDQANFDTHIGPNLSAGNALGFARGSAVRSAGIVAPEGVDVFLVAPIAESLKVRTEYVAGRGIPHLLAVDRDATSTAWGLVLSYAKAVGATRVGARRTTVAEATETATFIDQVVRGGAMPALVATARQVLIDAGHNADMVDLQLGDAPKSDAGAASVIDDHVKQQLAAALATMRATVKSN